MKREALVALITPFDEDLNIDFYALGRIIDKLLEENCDGFIVCGTTAESPTLSMQEKLDILDYVIERTRGRGQIWFGCGSNDTAATCEFVKQVEHRNIDGLLIVTPYYNKPSQQGLYEHYAKIVSSTKLPIMVYNVPGRTGISITGDTLCHLAGDFDQIVALKQASRDLDIVHQVQSIRPDFKVYSGEDGYLKEGLEAGMCGIISVMGHLNMKDLKNYLTLFDTSVDLDEQDQAFKALADLLFKQASPGPLKYLLQKEGLCLSQLRLPLTPVDEAMQKELDHWYALI